MRTLGPYTILGQLGRGGQGVVYLAEDTRLKRKVALKVIETVGQDMPADRLERFRREAEAASRLDHPNICAIHQAGEAEGIPYIAMRYVEGETLAEQIDAARDKHDSGSGSTPSTREHIHAILHRMEKVARALHAAHELGLIHRDIKPGNIMLTGDDEPIVLDFGLARDEFSGDDLSLTQSGDLLGTPAYMSPEQLMAQRIPLDRRTDIYSLGATLYESLTLRRPFEAMTRAELYQRIMTQEPSSVTSINRAIPTDLRVVLETALEKDRNRRYQTALDLAEDLLRVRRFEPIQAKPIGRMLRARRWAQRHPTLATGVLAIVLGVVGLALYSWRLDRALQISNLLAESDQLAESNPGKSLAKAREAVLIDATPETISQLHAALARQFETAEMTEHTEQIESLDYSPKFGLLSSGDTTARLWGLDGKERIPPITHEHPPFVAKFAPGDVNRILTGCSDAARVWTTDGVLLWTFDSGSPTSTTCWNPDGSSVLTGHEDGSIRLWDAATGKQVFEGPAHHRLRVDRAFFVPDGRLFTHATDGTIKIGDPRHELPVVSLSLGLPVTAWAIDRSGKLLATGDDNGLVRTWNTKGKLVHTLEGHRDEVRTIAFSKTGDRILTGSYDNSVRLWSLDDASSHIVVWHGGDVEGAAFLRDEARVLSWSGDTIVKVSRTNTRGLFALRGHRDIVNRAVIVDEEVVVTGAEDGAIKVWNLRGKKRNARPGAGPRVAFDRAGRYAIAGYSRIRVWGKGNEPEWEAPYRPSPHSLAFSPAGHLFVGNKHGVVAEFDPAGSSKMIREKRVHSRDVFTLQFSPDGSKILTCSYDGTATLWNKGFERIKNLWEDEGGLKFASWSPDGKRIALPGASGRVRVCDDNGEELWTRQLHGNRVRSASFAPDSLRVLTGSSDGTAILWNSTGEKVLAEFKGHQSTVTSAEYSREGKYVVTSSRDGTIRLWRPDGTYLFSMAEPSGGLVRARFSPDGEWIVSSSSTGHVRFWPVEVEHLLRLSKQ